MKHLGTIEGGGTWFRAATGRADGTLLEQIRVPTTSPAETLSTLIQFFQAHPVEALGVGCFGPLSLSPDASDMGCIGSTPKPGWSGVDVHGILRQALGVPVQLQTDVIAAAIGEHRHGAGQGVSCLVYLTVGTGIGGGALLEGVPIGGRQHAEMGHAPTPRQPDDPFPGACPFHRDCLEGMASGPAMEARWGRPGEQLEAQHPAWELAGRILAEGLVTIQATLAPDRVILGGGVGSNPYLRRPLLTALQKKLAGYWPAVQPQQWVVSPMLLGSAALVGGLVMAEQARRRMP